MSANIEKRFRFREFQVYKDARIFSRDIKKLSKEKFPQYEQFELMSQLWRALDSVVLNIAEGADRSTDKDFALFLNRAHTSLNEVVACLDTALDNEYISQSEHDMYLEKAAMLADQLTAFRRKLLNDPTK